MKWRFWQKAYLATLLLFLTALFGGVFGMVYISWQQSFDAEADKAISRQQLLAGVMTNLLAETAPGHTWTLPALYEAYGKNATASGGALEMREGEKVLYGNLAPYGGQRPELAVGEGEIRWIVREVEQRHHLYVTSRLPGQSIVFTRTQDVSALFSSWRDLAALYLVACAAVSVSFALALFFILRRLSRPLEALTKSAKCLSAGSYETRVPVRGQDEVAELSASFNEMATSVQQNMEGLAQIAAQKQRLIDNLSHEIRTPTTAIQGYAEFAQRAATSAQQTHDILGRIQGETARLGRIANRMLALSATEHDQLEKVPVSVEALFRLPLRTLEGLAQEKELAFIVETEPPSLSVPGDKALLESVVLNLAENAVKACAVGGTVCLRAKETAEGVQISVSDNGRGMTAEQRRHLGEAFYRADKARSRREGGAGLGVALCFEVLRLHGGCLNYESESGKGTTATAILPW